MSREEQVKRIFENSGVSVAEWARQRGYSVQLVYRVLSGKHQALRGQSHRIAVDLGIKVGNKSSVDELCFQPILERDTGLDE